MRGDVAAERSGWRGLGAFWAVVVVVGGATALTLQAMGPPGAPTPTMEHGAEPATGPAPVVAPVAVQDGKVVPPVPALLEVSRALSPAQLPRVAPDGRMSRLVYAAPVPPVPAGAVRIALLLSGFGLSDHDSQAAIGLPGPVSLAVSSYAPATAAALVTQAREAGHEVLASIPMEPQGYPQNDEGARSLMTGRPPEENRLNLEWALSRTPGVVGATGASDGMRGERFADVSASFDPVLEEVTGRGLLYVDARPGRSEPPGMPVRAVDTVIDDQPGRADIDARLLSLERSARERGGAIGLIGASRPTTIERVSTWIGTLPARGFVLVPVSALVNP